MLQDGSRGSEHLRLIIHLEQRDDFALRLRPVVDEHELLILVAHQYGHRAHPDGIDAGRKIVQRLFQHILRLFGMLIGARRLVAQLPEALFRCYLVAIDLTQLPRHAARRCHIRELELGAARGVHRRAYPSDADQQAVRGGVLIRLEQHESTFDDAAADLYPVTVGIQLIQLSGKGVSLYFVFIFHPHGLPEHLPRSARPCGIVAHISVGQRATEYGVGVTHLGDVDRAAGGGCGPLRSLTGYPAILAGRRTGPRQVAALENDFHRLPRDQRLIVVKGASGMELSMMS